jgi:peptide/nickel transport system substrate-binding protein
LAAAVGLVGAASPDRLTWGVHVSLAPTWFEPAEASGIITPFMVLYALHDAVVKPMPGKALAPSLAESFTAAEDGRSYDFVLREGARLHNGDPVTSADVKFSFERYRGVAHACCKRVSMRPKCAAPPLPPEAPVAGFPDLLRNGDGRPFLGRGR